LVADSTNKHSPWSEQVGEEHCLLSTSQEPVEISQVSQPSQSLSDEHTDTVILRLRAADCISDDSDIQGLLLSPYSPTYTVEPLEIQLPQVSAVVEHASRKSFVQFGAAEQFTRFTTALRVDRTCLVPSMLPSTWLKREVTACCNALVFNSCFVTITDTVVVVFAPTASKIEAAHSSTWPVLSRPPGNNEVAVVVRDRD
jgi:hypothetical protein